MQIIPHSRPWIDESDLRAVRDILLGEMIAQGAEVRSFENTFAEYVGCSRGVATGSGTAALVLALRALRVSAGNEVILPTYTCRNVLDAVRAVGASPVLCDVGADWNMTAETVARHVTPRTSAMIVVSTFGIANPLDSFRELNIPIVEDSCQRLVPATPSRGKPSGSEIRVFSFHATKCLATGEGGMATSPDEDLVDAMRRLRDGDDSARPDERRVASPMTDLQAALGRSQLARYGEFLARRQRIAERYFRELATDLFERPNRIQARSMFFRYPLRWRGEFLTIQRGFADRGIHVRKGVDQLLHRILKLDDRLFPVAERLFAETVSLPIYPALSEKEQDRVIAACLEFPSSP
jgi:UDP-4-amino-4-deoxy-L-arabinose-oxoglutarate aminotransferase